MKKFLQIVTLSLLAVSSAYAQGTDVLPFSRIDRNPITAGFAGAGAAYDGSVAYSAFGNAAMLPFYDGKLDAAFSFQSWAPSSAPSKNVAVGVAYKPSSKFAFSLGYALQNGAAYDVLDNDGMITGSFSPKDHVIAAGLAFGLGSKLSVGVNARFLMQKLSSDLSYNGFSGDVFVAFQPIKSLRIAAGVSTIGNSITAYNKKKYSQPASAKLGVNWGMVFAQTSRVDLLADFDYYFSGQYGASVGAGYSWNNTVFVRAGYRYASTYCVIPSHLSLGVGAKFAGFRIDVNFITASQALGNTLGIGVGYTF
jgi:hypothetical protein